VRCRHATYILPVYECDTETDKRRLMVSPSCRLMSTLRAKQRRQTGEVACGCRAPAVEILEKFRETDETQQTGQRMDAGAAAAGWWWWHSASASPRWRGGVLQPLVAWVAGWWPRGKEVSHTLKVFVGPVVPAAGGTCGTWKVAADMDIPYWKLNVTIPSANPRRNRWSHEEYRTELTSNNYVK
jgi:hypothetical protein